MMFYIKAKVSIRVAGISAPFEDMIAWLVSAPNVNIAKQKYEARVSNDFKHMLPQEINFSYVEVTGQIL